MSAQVPHIKTYKRLASSGQLEYGASFILSETARTRIVMVPYFIKRTAGPQLHVSIKHYSKLGGQWTENRAKSLSFDGQTAQALVAQINAQLAVLGENALTDYVVIPLAGEAGLAGTSSIGKIFELLARADIITLLDVPGMMPTIPDALKTALRLKELREAIQELEGMLGRGIVEEQRYQEWCDAHSWAFGNAYVVNDTVRRISATDTVDVLLPVIENGFRDLVELKRPNMGVLNRDAGHNCYYFSAEASSAIGQCHRYMDVLQDVAATGLRDHPEIIAYHPHATIVIGRSNDWPDDKLKALHGLNRRIHGITILTYDQLLARAKKQLELMTLESR